MNETPRLTGLAFNSGRVTIFKHACDESLRQCRWAKSRCKHPSPLPDRSRNSHQYAHGHKNANFIIFQWQELKKTTLCVRGEILFSFPPLLRLKRIKRATLNVSAISLSQLYRVGVSSTLSLSPYTLTDCL